MRTQIYIVDYFSRDVSWISQEFIEDYAGALLRGGRHAEYCIEKWTRGDKLKIQMFMELAATHPDIQSIQDELIDEFGIDYFVGKPKSKEYHIRQLEIEIQNARSSDDKAKLYKELREYNGWTIKAVEKSVTVKSASGSTTQQDLPNDLREAERIVMTMFAGKE